MKVAIIGGAGLGRALARRLHALGEDAYIGSRDAERARERALELGVQAALTRGWCTAPTWSCWQRSRTRFWRPPSPLRTRSARHRCSAWRAICASQTRVSCRASRRGRWPRTIAVDPGPRRLGSADGLGDRPLSPGASRPGRAGLRRRPGHEGARARAGRPPRRRARDRCRPARELARARGHDRRDPEREQAARCPRGLRLTGLP